MVILLPSIFQSPSSRWYFTKTLSTFGLPFTVPFWKIIKKMQLAHLYSANASFFHTLMKFEWDEAKWLTNIHKHGIDLLTSRPFLNSIRYGHG